MTVSETMELLVESPRLPHYVEELKRRLQAEAEAREQFINEIRDDQKAEFINGKVIMYSPAKVQHSEIISNLLPLMSAYIGARALGRLFVERSLIRLSRNDYEPDMVFFASAKAASFTPRQVILPAPDLVVEVLSDSTEHRDRGIKYEDYAAHGVAEYWIIDPEAQTVEQYQLQGNAYRLAAKLSAGTIKSFVITGFEIPVRAIFDEAESHRTLKKIVLDS